MKNSIIQIKNVNKKYRNVHAVKNLSFEVFPGECFGLLGPNGAGKTTMMKVVYGMNSRDKINGGDVDVMGYDPAMDEISIKYMSGIVQQEDNLDAELTVLQNLNIYAKFYGMKKKEAIPKIEELLTFMELNEKKESRIRELSGGMKRRLSIARALLNNPKLLILDEPTTGLDPQVRHMIWDKLRLLKRNGVTIILTTHYMEEAYQICDRIIIMHNGQKVLEGQPAKLIRENMENYVLEIYGDSMKKVENHTSSVRVENTENRTLMYSNNIQELEGLCNETCTAGEFFLRQTNLEDLFLKTTGRNLNE